jgi:hypothetical protein
VSGVADVTEDRSATMGSPGGPTDTLEGTGTGLAVGHAAPGSKERSGAASVRRWWPGALSCGIYVVLAMLEFGHFGSLGSAHMTGIGSMDAIEQIWWLAWTAFALPHGHNVLLAQWQNFPSGQNFGVNGSMLALGVVFSPITKLFGPVVTWNVLMRLAVAISASSMCLVLRRFTAWWPAAFVGGLLYGFSAYTTYWEGGGGYLFLIFVPLPPLVLLFLHEALARQKWRPLVTGTVLGLTCVVQYFISTEVLASTVATSAIAVVVLVLWNRHDLVDRWRYAFTSMATGLGVAAVLLVAPVVFTLAGPQHINGVPSPPSKLALIRGDLLSSILPTGQWLGPSHPSSGLTFRYAGALYLGIPLLIALIAFAIFLRRRRAILFFGSMALITFVLSLGPRLYVDGHETPIRLPFLLLERVPVLQGLLSERLALYTALFSAAMFAVGIDELRLRLQSGSSLSRLSPARMKQAAVVTAVIISAAVILPLVPARSVPTTPTTSPTVPSFFTSKAVSAIAPGSVVLAYPYPDAASTGWISIFHPGQSILLDQAIADMRFKVIGGYGWFPSPTGHSGTTNPAILPPPSVQALFDVAFTGRETPAQTALLSKADLTSDLRQFLRRFGVQAVIVMDQGGRQSLVINHLTSAIGPAVSSGGVTVWPHVQRRLASPSS